MDEVRCRVRDEGLRERVGFCGISFFPGFSAHATAGGTVPYIANVNYQYQAPNLVFSIEAYDPDGNFGSPLLLWSVNGSPQPTQTIPSASPGEAFFNITLSGITAGETYQVLFAIRDADGNVSDGYSLSATAS